VVAPRLARTEHCQRAETDHEECDGEQNMGPGRPFHFGIIPEVTRKLILRTLAYLGIQALCLYDCCWIGGR
jgi:hypothetical protein